MNEEEGLKPLQSQETISKPPLNILFNPNLVAKKNIWDIDITSLLEKLVAILDTSEDRDLRLCGLAALSSAIILRLKVESIFALEKIAMQRKTLADRSMVENIKVLDMPYRYEATYPVSLEDLLGVLENMMAQIANPRHKKELEIEPIESHELDKYLISFDELLEKYKGAIFEKLLENKILMFNEFIMTMEPIEVARYFIGMLYLAMHEKIDLEQTEDDIRLVLKS